MVEEKSLPGQTIGLIAGNGRLPLLFIKSAKERNYKVIAVAFYQETSRRVAQLADKVCWINVGELSRLAEIFQKENIKHAVMIGQIRHTFLLRRLAIDDELTNLLGQVKDKKTDTLLGKIAEWLENKGIILINSTTFLSEYMPGAGVRTKIPPATGEWEDIRFGVDTAKYLGAADIGQTVVVKDKIVLAVEAIEGTDQTIRRGGRLARGSVVVKTSKPEQDFRFDVPVIGPRTITNLTRVKAKILAYEAGKTLIIDEPACVKLANRHNICIVGV
ncbi:MAG: UDP-2,3-diacylglucosamine diphosphatase LpxI [Candidatus Omnitrophota bacterium]